MKNRFRVWLPDPDVKKMLRVKSLVFEKDRTRCICGYAYDFYLENEDATLMQSTGLFDKNGKEIFEGDVLKVTDKHSWLEVVSFSEKKAMFVSKEIGFPESPLWELFNTVLFEIEIIGNIYENPELAEVSS